MQDISKIFFILLLMGLIQACSGDSFSGSSTAIVTNGGVAAGAGCTDVPPPAGCIVVSDQLSLSLSEQQIKSDGQDSTTITASVLDTDRAAIKDVQVTFTANAGKLSSSVAFTDENGNAIVTFTSGTADPSNQIATVTATVVNVPPASIPIEIIGTTLVIDVTNTSLQIPSGQTQIQETIKVTATDAGGQRIYNVPIAFNVSPAATVTASLSSPQINTDTRGEVSVTMTASGSGNVTFTAQGLGITATQLFTVANIVADNPFRITAPTTDPYPLVADGGVNSTVAIDVAAQNVTTVRFSTSIGQWTTGVPLGSNAVVDVATVAGVASATLQANAGDHGFATIVVSDATDSTVFDSITIAMSPPVVNASKIFIQSDVNVLAPSTGTTTYQANLEARVVTDDASGNFPIFNVPVLFELANLPGGGETLTNSFGLTDLNGVVRTTFQSGTLPSGQNAVAITATVVNAPTTIADTINVVIGGTGGSVALGHSTLIETEEDNTAIYRIDMAAAVADSNGNAVAGSNVTLSMWPDSYYSGSWYDADPDPDKESCDVYYSGGPFTNEDRDEDLIMDQEILPVFVVNEDTNLDGELTPHNSTAGTAPSTVITDAEGVGAFKLTYLKQYSIWVNVRARGHTKVQGTETTGTLRFLLLPQKIEADPCLLAESPFPLMLMGTLGGAASLVTNPLPASAAGLTPYTFPLFEDTPSLDASVGIGSMTPLALGGPKTYVLPPIGSGFNVGDVFTTRVTLSADPNACALANCTDLNVSFLIRVVVIAP